MVEKSTDNKQQIIENILAQAKYYLKEADEFLMQLLILMNQNQQ
jgi:hypothetical protein